MKFSIIVPAYKSEKFIARCLESLVTQDFPAEDFEIIVVDDCSPDNQNDIVYSFITKFSSRNNIIRLIKHPENRRQGGARNTGIAEAKGDWILFVDSDDFWTHNKVLQFFALIVNNNPDADLIDSISHFDVYSLSQPLHPPKIDNKIEVFSGEEYYKSGYFESYVWRSAYRREYLKKFKFRENVFFEDGDFRVKVILGASKIVKIDYPFYAYVNNTDSTIRSSKEEVFFANVEANRIILEIILSHLDKDVKRIGLVRLKTNVFSWLKISKDYPISVSRKVYQYARHMTMFEVQQYPLSKTEKWLMLAMKHTPLAVVTGIKCGVLSRRIIRKILNYRPS